MARQFLSSVVDQELYIQTSAFLKSIGTAEVVSERYDVSVGAISFAASFIKFGDS